MKKELVFGMVARQFATKVAVDAFDRMSALRKKYGASLIDTVSIMFMCMPEELFAEKLKQQREATAATPRRMKGLIRDVEGMPDDEYELMLAEFQKARKKK